MEVDSTSAPALAETPATPAPPENPSETLYIQNLNERVKPATLKITLTNLFTNFGPVLSVVAHSNLRMRGQAFVSFSSSETAATAKKEVNNFPLYGKPMIINYARTRSDSVVKELEGAERLEKWKEERKDHKRKTRYDNPLKRKLKLKKLGGATVAAGEKRPNVMMPDEYLPPNKILFVQNLPMDLEGGQDALRALLNGLFSQYPNLHEIRLIPTKKDIAFVEYTDEDSATVAKDGLHNWKLDGDRKIKITFARK
ncbi:hypothetical protein DL96DRAFT_1669041 [Flagelloscypha sp. PMI_526]|nr:hypothetical protein DL96DRAFT_1669041 [Flagelloscypha sp. PMI_526]